MSRGVRAGTGRFGMGRNALFAGAAAALLALAAPVAAQTINPFGDHPGGMTAAEREAMGAAIGKVLDAGEAGATAHWSVGAVGGTAKAEKVYDSGGMACVLVGHSFDNSTRPHYALPFCKTEKGWKVYF